MYAAIAVGMYVFLRALDLSARASVLAAGTYAFAGPVLSQVNHVDMTEAFVAIPWMSWPCITSRDGRWRWAILLAVAYASVVLAGAPEAMLDEALMVGAFAVLTAGLDRGRWWRVLSRCATGAALALSLSAIQWLPGLEAIKGSQRGSGVFAAAGSYPTPFSIFALVPYLDGGYGHLGETSFFSQYNLPEVGIYLGILPIVAVLTLLHPRWPSRIEPRQRFTWYGVALFGYLLALGSNTPLEHLFNRLPLYGHQRLQSRNMITVATAVCVLFAGWLDRREPARPRDPLTRYDRIMALVPVTIVAALAVWALTATGSLVHVFAGVAASPSISSTVREATAVALAFCVGAAVLVWVRPRLGVRGWTAWIACSWRSTSGSWRARASSPRWPPTTCWPGRPRSSSSRRRAWSLGGAWSTTTHRATPVTPGSPQGIPDLNIVPGLPSVSGYASIVNGNYEAVTHTHEQGDLDVGELAMGSLDRLDLRQVVTVPEYFLVPVASVPRTAGDLSQLPEYFGEDPVLEFGSSADNSEAAYSFVPPPRAVAPGAATSWFYGERLAPERVTLVLDHPTAVPTEVRVGAVDADGSTRWEDPVPVAAGARRVEAALPAGEAVGLSVTPTRLSSPRYARWCRCQAVPMRWPGRCRRPWCPDPGAPPASRRVTWCSPRPARTADHRYRRRTVAAGAGAPQHDQVRAGRVRALAAAVIVRSVAWDAGWTATVSVGGAAAKQVPVHDVDLVQQVRVPPGDDLVTFTYRPPHLAVAGVLSLGAARSLVVLLGGWLVVRRRRARRGTARSAVRMRQREEKFPVLGAPHAVDHESAAVSSRSTRWG